VGGDGEAIVGFGSVDGWWNVRLLVL